MGKRIKMVAAVAGVSLATVLASAIPAFATTGTSGGCTMTADTPVGNGPGGAISIHGAISCATSGTRQMYLELMHNYDNLPDATAAGRTFDFTKSVDKNPGVCDTNNAGRSTQYYTEVTSRNNGIAIGYVDSSIRVLSKYC